MTMTDERRKPLDLIDLASRGRIRTIAKSGIVCVLVIIALMAMLKSLAGDRRVVRAPTAVAQQASSCSDGYGLTSIWLATGCVNSPAPAQPQ